MPVLTQQFLLGGMGTCAVAAWLRIQGGKVAKIQRARAAELAWCVALMVIALAILVTLVPRYAHHVAVVVVPLAVGLAALLRPRLAVRLGPAALISLGLIGLMQARQYGYWSATTGRYIFLSVGGYNMTYYLVLPVAYALLALGGWLAWRQADRAAPLTRRILGALTNPAERGQRWALALPLVVSMAAGLFWPNIWLGGGRAGLIWTVIVLAVTFWIVTRRPDRGATLATAGMIVVGIAGLYAAANWPSWPLPMPRNGYALDGLVAISSRGILPDLAAVQSLALTGLGLWLAPRTIPQLRQFLGWATEADLLRRVQRLTESRAVAVDTAAADLRRLERDLHDGAQARLVALGMNLRAAERLIMTSPEAAAVLVAEAREASVRALSELRELVRGVHPPVLADRGLGDALRALALDSPLRIETDIDLPGRLPAPVETACYFAVAELLTNAAKHSGAREGRISAMHEGGLLHLAVTDFGMGGADPARGTGLAGVEKRLATFDGIVAVSSPAGGPTMVVLEVPCASSSQKTSSC
jgi:signal transduction histidine kinase